MEQTEFVIDNERGKGRRSSRAILATRNLGRMASL